MGQPLDLPNFPLRGCCTLSILVQEKVLAEIYLPEVVLNMVSMGKNWKMLLENVRETKGREFNQHELRVN